MPAALRRAYHLPVGRAITRPAKTRSIDERLQPINRMRVNPLPILSNEFGHAAEKMRSQMFYTNPRQNQKAHIVSQQMNVALTRFVAPFEVAVAHFQMTRRALPGHTRDRLAVGFHW